MPEANRDEELARLRDRPDNVHLAGGYGPLLVGAVLFVMMVLLAPTIAPEQVVERPVNGTTTTVPTTSTTTASSTTATPSSTQAAPAAP